jgi:hypothetical protein
LTIDVNNGTKRVNDWFFSIIFPLLIHAPSYFTLADTKFLAHTKAKYFDTFAFEVLFCPTLHRQEQNAIAISLLRVRLIEIDLVVRSINNQ